MNLEKIKEKVWLEININSLQSSRVCIRVLACVTCADVPRCVRGSFVVQYNYCLCDLYTA